MSAHRDACQARKGGTASPLVDIAVMIVVGVAEDAVDVGHVVGVVGDVENVPSAVGAVGDVVGAVANVEGAAAGTVGAAYVVGSAVGVATVGRQ